MRCTECGCGYSFLRILNAEPVQVVPRLTIGSWLPLCAAPSLHGYCSLVHFLCNLFFFSFLFIVCIFAHFYCIHLCVQFSYFPVCLFVWVFFVLVLGLYMLHLFDSAEQVGPHCAWHYFIWWQTHNLHFEYLSSLVGFKGGSCNKFGVWPSMKTSSYGHFEFISVLLTKMHLQWPQLLLIVGKKTTNLSDSYLSSL